MTPSENDYHDRYLAEQLRDPIFKYEYERNKRRLLAIDAAVNAKEAGAAPQPRAVRDDAAERRAEQSTDETSAP